MSGNRDEVQSGHCITLDQGVCCDQTASTRAKHDNRNQQNIRCDCPDRCVRRSAAAACATAGAAQDQKRLSSGRILAILLSEGTPHGECRSDCEVLLMALAAAEGDGKKP